MRSIAALRRGARPQDRLGGQRYPPGIAAGHRWVRVPWRRGDAGAAVLRRRRRGAALRAGRAAARDRAAAAVAGDPAARTAARGHAAGPHQPRRHADRGRLGAAARGPGGPRRGRRRRAAHPPRRARRDRPPRPGPGHEGRRVRANCWRSCSTRTPPNPARSPSRCCCAGPASRNGCCATAGPTWRCCTGRSTRRPDSTPRSSDTEGQVVVLPAGHPAHRRAHVRMADVTALPDLPLPRWPGPTAPTRTAPARRSATTTQLLQLIALGRPGRPAGVGPRPAARRPRRRAGAGRARGHHRHRLAAAQPLPSRRRPGPDRDAPLTGNGCPRTTNGPGARCSGAVRVVLTQLQPLVLPQPSQT